MRFKEPMDLGGFRLCSRLVLPPMATKKSTPEGLVTEDLIEHYRRRAEGGSLENRLRIHREIIRGIRKRLGEDYPIAVRLGGCDHMAGGNTVEDAAQACRILEAEGVALLDISGGMCRYIRKDTTEFGYFADTSVAVKRRVKTPVLLTGGITAAEQAEALLQRGAADLIGVGRALLKDADWARTAMNDKSA